MKCDLHVHTIHSGMCTVPLLNRICRESYSDPEDVYQTLKRRGMDLVTVTDHDSIDAVESLRRYPDFFLSEEVTCRTSRGTELHMGVYGISEHDHIELQRRRDDLDSLMAYLREQDHFFTINHAFSGLTGRRTAADFAEFAAHFPGVETRNGQMSASANAHAKAFALRNGLAPVAGSDSHTLECLGRTYTEVSGQLPLNFGALKFGAADLRDFLQAVKQGRGIARGEAGSYLKLTKAACAIGIEMLEEKPWTRILAPLLALVPVITMMNVVQERLFAARWGARLNPDLEPKSIADGWLPGKI